MTVQPAEQVAAKSKRSRIENLELVRKVWPWAFLLTLIVLFSFASQALNDVTFLSSRSVQGILLYATQVLLIGLAQTFVIIAAGIDLSSGWVLGLASVVAALVMQTLHAAGHVARVTIAAGMLSGILITDRTWLRQRHFDRACASAALHRYVGHGYLGGRCGVVDQRRLPYR